MFFGFSRKNRNSSAIRLRFLPSGSCHAARFRSASSRSRAALPTVWLSPCSSIPLRSISLTGCSSRRPAHAMQLDFASLHLAHGLLFPPSASRHAARFRSAPSRSRAAPYARRKEGDLIRASTMRSPSFLLAHGLSLACKFAPVSLYEEEYDDERDYKCYV